jgi:hypothetical protein
MQHAAGMFFDWAAPRLSVGYRRMIKLRLDATDWDDYVPRLIAYTARRLGRTSRYRNLHGMTEHDYVQDAIRLIAEGDRHYYRTSRKPWFDFITAVIDSLTSGEHMKKEDHIQHLALTAATDERKPAGTCSEWQLPGTPANQEEVVVEQRFLVFTGELPQKVGEYALLRRSELYATAAEYARALGTDEADIRNRHKLLKRRRAKWDDL